MPGDSISPSDSHVYSTIHHPPHLFLASQVRRGDKLQGAVACSKALQRATRRRAVKGRSRERAHFVLPGVLAAG